MQDVIDQTADLIGKHNRSLGEDFRSNPLRRGTIAEVFERMLNGKEPEKVEVVNQVVALDRKYRRLEYQADERA